MGRALRRSLHTAVGVAIIGRTRGLALRQGDSGGELEANAGGNQRGNGADGNKASDKVHDGESVWSQTRDGWNECACV